MTISEQVQKDMVDAMRSRDELRLSTLRMVKAALKNKEVEVRGAAVYALLVAGFLAEPGWHQWHVGHLLLGQLKRHAGRGNIHQ